MLYSYNTGVISISMYIHTLFLVFDFIEVEAVSSMQAAAWPSCVSNNQPHRPSGLILAQIIPANGTHIA